MEHQISPTKIMFICHGNICRSPMAEFVMKHLVSQRGLSSIIEVRSSAVSSEELGNDTHYGTKKVLTAHKVPFSPRRATKLKKSDKDKYDFLVAMDESNIRWMKDIFGEKNNKVRLLMDYVGEHRDVADPWYTGDFETTYRDVLRGCTALLNKITGTDQEGEK